MPRHPTRTAIDCYWVSSHSQLWLPKDFVTQLQALGLLRGFRLDLPHGALQRAMFDKLVCLRGLLFGWCSAMRANPDLSRELACAAVDAATVRTCHTQRHPAAGFFLGAIRISAADECPFFFFFAGLGQLPPLPPEEVLQGRMLPLGPPDLASQWRALVGLIPSQQQKSLAHDQRRQGGRPR